MGKKVRQQDPKSRSPWVAPQVKLIGDLKEIVRGGGGKISLAGADPGDIRKPSGGEP